MDGQTDEPTEAAVPEEGRIVNGSIGNSVKDMITTSCTSSSEKNTNNNTDTPESQDQGAGESNESEMVAPTSDDQDIANLQFSYSNGAETDVLLVSSADPANGTSNDSGNIHDSDAVSPSNISSISVDGEEAARCIPFMANSNIPLSMLGTDAVILKEDDVLQVHIQQESLVKSEDTEVILVYQDVLTCGICSKQFLDMQEFLEHKIDHSIGNSFYRCELCKMFFMKQIPLITHYRKRHRLPNFGDGLMVQFASQEGYPPDGNKSQEEDGSVSSQKSDRQESTDENSVTLTDGKLLSPDGPDPAAEEGDSSKHQYIITGMKADIAEDYDDDDNNADDDDDDEEEDGQPVNGICENGKFDLTNHSVPPVSDLAHDNSTGTVMESTEAPVATKLQQQPTALQVKQNGHLGNKTSKIRQSSRIGNRTARASGKTAPQSSLAESQDFSFILVTEPVKGHSFNYGKITFNCLHCDYKTQAKTAIAKHMNNRHHDMLDIHESFSIKENLQNDRRKVMKMSTYEALHRRDGQFRRRNRRGRKIEKQDIPGVFPCVDCGKIFHRLRYLRKHSLTHRNDKRHLCDECGKAFKSRTNLSQHRKVHIKEKLFECNQCNFQSRVNAAIHAHRQIHSQGSVLCDICGYAYTNKSTLNKHKRVHDLTRPYACNFPGCTWRFKTEIMCKAHIRAHTTEGKFKCSFCGYAFRHKHHLLRHESNTHGIRRPRNKTHSIGIPSKSSDTVETELTDTVSLVVKADAHLDHLQVDPNNLAQQHLVVTTDTSGTPITYEAADISALNIAYQTLMQGQDGQCTEGATTILMTQPETQVVFQQ